METSTNLGFYLPSSDSDDIADINQISDNFRNLDEYIPGMFREVKADIRTKQDALEKIEFEDNETITVKDNTVYIAKTDITSLTVIYPNTDFICSLEFAIANEGNVTITFPESKYIGGAPSFANGEVWEINIKNGVVVGGKVE